MRIRTGSGNMQNAKYAKKNTSIWCSNHVEIAHRGLAEAKKVMGVRRSHN